MSDILEHVADEDSDGDTYLHMEEVHGIKVGDDEDPVVAHLAAHEEAQ